MKFISIILMSLFLINNLSAKDYLFEAYGVSELSTIEISENFKFSAYTSEGMWDDNNGDYGNEKCSGYLKQKNKKAFSIIAQIRKSDKVCPSNIIGMSLYNKNAWFKAKCKIKE